MATYNVKKITIRNNSTEAMNHLVLKKVPLLEESIKYAIRIYASNQNSFENFVETYFRNVKNHMNLGNSPLNINEMKIGKVLDTVTHIDINGTTTTYYLERKFAIIFDPFILDASTYSYYDDGTQKYSNYGTVHIHPNLLFKTLMNPNEEKEIYAIYSSYDFNEPDLYSMNDKYNTFVAGDVSLGTLGDFERNGTVGYKGFSQNKEYSLQHFFYIPAIQQAYVEMRLTITSYDSASTMYKDPSEMEISNFLFHNTLLNVSHSQTSDYKDFTKYDTNLLAYTFPLRKIIVSYNRYDEDFLVYNDTDVGEDTSPVSKYGDSLRTNKYYLKVAQVVDEITLDNFYMLIGNLKIPYNPDMRAENGKIFFSYFYATSPQTQDIEIVSKTDDTISIDDDKIVDRIEEKNHFFLNILVKPPYYTKTPTYNYLCPIRYSKLMKGASLSKIRIKGLWNSKHFLQFKINSIYEPYPIAYPFTIHVKEVRHFMLSIKINSKNIPFKAFYLNIKIGGKEIFTYPFPTVLKIRNSTLEKNISSFVNIVGSEYRGFLIPLLIYKLEDLSKSLRLHVISKKQQKINLQTHIIIKKPS